MLFLLVGSLLFQCSGSCFLVWLLAAVSPSSSDSGSLSHRAGVGWGFLLAGSSEPKDYMWLRPNYFEIPEM